jgi:HEAT repeat protein
LKEDIVRTVSVKQARPVAAPSLIKAFEDAADDEELYLKWAIGNGLSVVADDSVFEDLVRLARDKKHGRAREMLCFALGNMKNTKAQDVLVELLDDEQVVGHAIRRLGKLKALKARSKIETFTSHRKAWIRREAKRALEKIDRAKGSKQ